MSARCPECRVAGGEADALGSAPMRVGSFLVHPKLEPPPVPGWLVVAPARHVEQIDELTEAEAAALGPLLARVAAALRASTPTAKVYTAAFGEVLPHLHLHVIARPPDDARRGPALFAAPPGDPDACRAVAQAVFKLLDPGVK